VLFSIFNKKIVMKGAENFQIDLLKDKSNKVPLLEKLFVWSIITEPLLFFVLYYVDNLTIGITLSRAIQVLFLLLYAFYILIGRRGIPIIKLTKKYYFYFFIFVLLILVSSFIGLMNDSYTYTNNLNEHTDSLAVIYRPFVELFILIYYLIYFVVLPKLILRTNFQRQYFLKWIIRIFYFAIVLGLIDFLVNYTFRVDLIPRLLYDSRWVNVGPRFHSFLGEPRDAFVFLLFGSAVLHLRSVINNTKPPGIFFYIILILCLIATKSFSGIIGLIIGVFFMVCFINFSLKRFLTIFSISIFAIILIYLAINNISRLENFYIVLLSLLVEHEWASPEQMPMLIRFQAPEILPFLEIFDRFITFDIYHLFYGSGLGSASFFLNNYFNSALHIVDNPNAQVVRFLFEAGLIGTLAYLVAIFKPLFLFNNLIENKKKLVTLIPACFFYGSIMGHRSHLDLVFAGILILFLVNQSHEHKL